MNRFCLLAAAWLLAAFPASAHHSFAAEYDARKAVTLTGPVVKVEWTNPHVHVVMSSKGERGTANEWVLELGSPNVLLRQGWTRNLVKPGDMITAQGYLAKDGSRTANARIITLPDGKQIFGRAAYEGGSNQAESETVPEKRSKE